MPTDSDIRARPDPRLVPTLTQVVGRAPAEAPNPLAQQGGAAAVEAPGSDPLAPPLAAEAGLDATAQAPLAEPLLRALGDELERRLGEAIAHALDEQLLGLTARLHALVAEEVGAAVADALQRQPATGDASGNP